MALERASKQDRNKQQAQSLSSQRKPKKQKNPSVRRNIWLLILTTLLVAGSVVMFVPPAEKINQGLDIQGGLSVVLSAKAKDGQTIDKDAMESSRAIIENRVNALGASETVVQLQGNNQILVQIPGLSDTEQALNTIGRTGSLVFTRLDSVTDKDVKEKIEKGQYADSATYEDEFGNTFPTGETEHLSIPAGTYTPLITGDNISKVSIGRASQTATDYSVNITLDGAGTTAFAEATKELAASNGQIVIILDDEVQSAPSVKSEIPSGQVSITGGYDLDEARSMQTVLESGSLPVSFGYEQSQVVGPTLGQDALRSGVIVALIGIIIVMLYLLVFYKGLGLITAAAMAIFAILYLGILATLSAFGMFSLSLAGIAGIVLTIGMAADSSILTLERFREEIRMGKSVRSASQSGVRHAIFTSIDADLVTMVSALSLFFLAAASVKGFGLTLALGIICDIVMMVLFKAPLIRLLAPKSITKHPGFWGINDSLAAAKGYEALAEAEGVTTAEAESGEQMNAAETDVIVAEKEALSPAKTAQDSVALRTVSQLKGRFIKHDINFLGYRKIFLTAAAIAMVVCFAVVGIRGLNFGIEFIGGTSISFHNTGEVTTEELREAFTQADEPNAVIQTTTTNGEPGFLVRTTTVSAEDATTHAKKVADNFGWTTENFEVTTIGPDWGASVIQSSLIAFLVSIILIIIYIAIRFEYKMGIMAIVALFHDLILVIGIYALVGREVNPNTIAALLTILGYSLYDTVVVFHRINDNMKGADIRCTFMTMANHSLNQVLIRTLNTTLTSFIPVLAMLLFGGETLKDFAFAMVIGLLAGSYSSIAIATPLYAMWKTREPKFAKLQNKYGTEIGLFGFDRSESTVIEQVPLSRLEAAMKGDVETVVDKDAESNENVTKKASAKKSAKNQGGEQLTTAQRRKRAAAQKASDASAIDAEAAGE